MKGSVAPPEKGFQGQTGTDLETKRLPLVVTQWILQGQFKESLKFFKHKPLDENVWNVFPLSFIADLLIILLKKQK